MTSVALSSDAAAPLAPTTGLKRLLVLFTLSGTAGLIYEMVWFQLLRLTIGATSHSLGILLASFMTGLLLGSLLYARVVPVNWHPLRTYAFLELLIGLWGLGMPWLIGLTRWAYFGWSTSPGGALVLRYLIATLLLIPPTVLMGATLPALARWVRSDRRQVSRIGWLYAANIWGAVAGVFGSTLWLLPEYGLLRTNAVAVGLNGLVALLALTIRSSRRGAEPAAGPTVNLIPADSGTESTSVSAQPASLHGGPHPWLVLIAYGLSGMASLSFQVLWARLLSLIFGMTVYAFGLVLGVFLAGLGLGGAVGSAILPRVRHPRRALAVVQLGIVGAAGVTPLLVSMAPFWWLYTDLGARDLWTLTLTNLFRTGVVVLPGAFLWGMAFPLALACLGRRFADPARPVGRLYAINTIGAVVGSLATSFLLIPYVGSSTGAAHLVWLPLLAVLVLYWPARLGWLSALAGACVAAGLVFWSDLPAQVAAAVRDALNIFDSRTVFLIVLFAPAFVGFELFLIRRVPLRLAVGAALSGLLVALGVVVPPEIYMLGRRYAYEAALTELDQTIVRFEEGAGGPVVVHRTEDQPLRLSVNGLVCASADREDMKHLRLLGHLPVLLSADPSRVLVVGMGAGVTTGCAALHDEVRHVRVVELERKVPLATAEFREVNHNALENPKVEVVFDDGRHHLAIHTQSWGVITSDPIDPYWAGVAALYSVEYYRLCRQRLAEGGIFMQWVGLVGLNETGMKSIIAAFAEAFPDGQVWWGPGELLFVGSTRPLRIDVAALRSQLERQPAVARSLAEVNVHTVEQLCSHLLCRVEDMGDYLADAEPTRDANLNIQYLGWQGYYRSGGFEVLRDQLHTLRRVSAELFLLPSDGGAEFMSAVEREWRAAVEKF